MTKPKFMIKTTTYTIRDNDEDAQKLIKHLEDKYEWGGAEVPVEHDVKEGVYRVSHSAIITREEFYEENK